MNIAPFLVLGLGLFWVLLVACAKDNRVHQPVLLRIVGRITASTARMVAALKQASISNEQASRALRRSFEALQKSMPRRLPRV